MKTLILILTILVTLNVNAQSDYKLYSKVWRFEYKSGYTKICPLDDDSFNGEFCDSVDKKLFEVRRKRSAIDTTKTLNNIIQNG